MKRFATRFFLILLTSLFLLNTIACGIAPDSKPVQIPIISPTANMITDPIINITPASIPLTGNWRFSIDKDKIGQAQQWFAPSFDDSTWETVSVPHTWDVMPPYADFEGLAWYRRAFTVPPENKDGHLRLHFEAVFYLARVWLNGQYLGEHEGGYTPFEFDISSIAQPGEQNLLAVQVDNLRATNRIPAVINPSWSYDWWNYGGITRDVSLEITSRAYISHQQLVSIPHLIGIDAADTAAITATIAVTNASGKTLNGSVRANLLDDLDGQPALTSPVSQAVNAGPGATVNIQLALTLASPKLWHFDHPNLYCWNATLLGSNGQVLHTDEVIIGIRAIELKNGYFHLNGEPVRLVGVTRHADYPGQGSAETVTAMAADYDDLKILNEVLSRPVHYPQNKFILDYADRHGILLIPEVPAWQLTTQQMNSKQMRKLEKQQLSEMISTDFNHPSVWAWSIANEIESNTTEGFSFVKEMVAYVKALDPTRPVGFASNRLASDPQFDATAVTDFVLMNQYIGTWVGPKQGLAPALDNIHKTYPDRTIIISEYGFEPHWNELGGPPTSTLTTAQYYFVPDGTPPDSEAADMVRRQLITEQMEVFRSKPFVAGAIFWTYQDYRTRSNFIMGLVDSNRNKRGSWTVLREQYAPALIDSLVLSPIIDGKRIVTVALHTRGPVDVDMPAYTLRGYNLHWAVTSPDGKTNFSTGDTPLPLTLAPGSKWRGDIVVMVPADEYIITVSIVRPTGYNVIEYSWNAKGELIP